MVDQWFKKDLQSIYDTHSVAVFIDESGDAEFLLKTVEKDFIIHTADTEVEELHVKYIIEKSQTIGKKYLVYTHTKRDNLLFIREYCETNGCLEIRYLENYIKEKVHKTLNLNINLLQEEMISAAKVSVGKDITYWSDLCHKGAAEIFDIEKELLPFIADPEHYEKEKYDPQLRETFYRKVCDLLDQKYMNKPAKTLAGEVMKAMFDGLLEDNINKTLEMVYINWLDSVMYRKSLFEYIENYTLPNDIEKQKVNINQPFRKVDEQFLEEIGKKLGNKKYISETLQLLRQREKSKQAQAIGIIFWIDVITLLEFDIKNISCLSSFDECVEFYTKHFYKLDTAIRNMYTEFLNNRTLLEPFQELYMDYVAGFLEKWFDYWHEYTETQTGTLQRIINEASEKVAVIVGDGISFEIAKQLALRLDDTFILDSGIILADVPSETENNMSRIYMDNGITEPVHNKREKYLVDKNQSISIDFFKLDEVTEEPLPGQLLVCTAKEIDSIGEKLQQEALKHFPEIIDTIAKKIALLLRNGYSKVYLVSDHGFVLTGLLSDADKITVLPDSTSKVKERYFMSSNKVDTKDWIVKERNDTYFYFSKSMNVFKSPGMYGFSHGGATPHEIITPFFCWQNKKGAKNMIQVSIVNKTELKDVTGDLYTIKLQAGSGKGDLFSANRAVLLVFFANKTQINKSDIITIDQNSTIQKEHTFEHNNEIEVQLLDATTKECLDKAVIKQNKARDLDGLL